MGGKALGGRKITNEEAFKLAEQIISEHNLGCKVNKIIPIQGYFPSPGASESYYHLFLGEVNSFEGERIMGLKSENEDILVSKIPSAPKGKKIRDIEVTISVANNYHNQKK